MILDSQFLAGFGHQLPLLPGKRAVHESVHDEALSLSLWLSVWFNFDFSLQERRVLYVQLCVRVIRDGAALIKGRSEKQEFGVYSAGDEVDKRS